MPRKNRIRVASCPCALLLCAAGLFCACQGAPESPNYVPEGAWDGTETLPSRTLAVTQAENLTVWMLGDGSVLPFREIPALESLDQTYNIRLQYAISGLATGYGPSDNAHRVQADEKQRLLITDLLGGEGPDVIILDACNAQDFAASGALMDLMDIAREAGVYDNLIDGLAMDGALPYIPYRVNAPLLFGPPPLVEEIHSFDDLVDGLAAGPPPQWLGPTFDMDIEILDADPLMLKAPSLPEEERAFVNFSSVYDIQALADPLYGARLIVENHLNTDVLREYYAQVKRALDASPLARENTPSPHSLLRSPDNLSGFQIVNSMPVMMGTAGASLYLKYARLAADGAWWSMEYGAPAMIAQASDEAMAVRPFPAQGAVWQPYTLMAVNKNTKHPDLALHFIRMMLGEEMQYEQWDNGFPATQRAAQRAQDAFAENLNGDYTRFEEIYGEECEGIQWMKDAKAYPYDLDGLMRSFDTVYMPNLVVSGALSEGLMAYVEGRLPLEEAVAQCADTLNMYLLERQK